MILLLANEYGRGFMLPRTMLLDESFAMCGVSWDGWMRCEKWVLTFFSRILAHKRGTSLSFLQHCFTKTYSQKYVVCFCETLWFSSGIEYIFPCFFFNECLDKALDSFWAVLCDLLRSCCYCLWYSCCWFECVTQYRDLVFGHPWVQKRLWWLSKDMCS